MAVTIVNRDYREIYREESTNWPLGNSGDWQELVVDVEVEIIFEASQQQPLRIDSRTNTLILGSGGKWNDFGFDDGMLVTLSYDLSLDTDGNGSIDVSSTKEEQYTIKSIIRDKMILEEPIQSDGFELFPLDSGNRKVSNVFVRGDQPIQGSVFSYGHIRNTDSESVVLNSLIDGTKTSFAIPNINAVPRGTYQQMEAIGFQSGMSIRSCEIRKVDSFAGEDNVDGRLDIFGITNFILDNAIGHNGGFNDRSYRNIQMFLTEDVEGFQRAENSFLVRPAADGRHPDGFDESGLIINQYPREELRSLIIDLEFRVVSTNDDYDGDTLDLILVRYEGAGRIFAEKIILNTWFDARSLLGQSLNFRKTQNLNINQGSSFSIGFEWRHDRADRASTTMEINRSSITISNPNSVFGSVGKQFFQYRLKYMYSTLFESIENFNPLQIPEFLAGEESLTDNFETNFFPIWNNPNISVTNDKKDTSRLGNIGWFNENFNQLRNRFKVESVQYLDGEGNTVDSLDYTQQTKVKVTISGVRNLGSNSEFGFGFAWVPLDDQDYKEKETPFYRNVFVQSGDINNGFGLGVLNSGPYVGSGIGGASMDTSNVKFSNVDGNVVMEANFIPNANFFALFDAKAEDDRNYILWVSVADGNLERNFSDRVSLIADVNDLKKNIPSSGPYPFIENTFLTHPENEMSIGDDCLEATVQDGILNRLPFKIKKDGSIRFENITLGIEIFNVGLQKTFDLQRFQIDLSQYPTDSNGVQQFDFETSRGFKLKTGNTKNLVSVKRFPELDNNNFSSYVAFFAFKIRWEDWILNNNAPEEFFNSDNLNNGFNNDWVDYLRTQGWEINFFSEIISTELGEIKSYRNKWNFKVSDYDENINLLKRTRYYRQSDNTLLNIGTDPETGRPLGVILSNERVRIEHDFEILDDGVWNLSEYYSTTTIEIDLGGGQVQMREISSIVQSESDNPLKPLEGFNLLKMELDGTGKILTTSCLVDPELLDEGQRYRVTGEVGCLGSGGVFSTRLYESKYELKYE